MTHSSESAALRLTSHLPSTILRSLLVIGYDGALLWASNFGGRRASLPLDPLYAALLESWGAVPSAAELLADYESEFHHMAAAAWEVGGAGPRTTSAGAAPRRRVVPVLPAHAAAARYRIHGSRGVSHQQVEGGTDAASGSAAASSSSSSSGSSVYVDAYCCDIHGLVTVAIVENTGFVSHLNPSSSSLLLQMSGGSEVDALREQLLFGSSGSVGGEFGAAVAARWALAVRSIVASKAPTGDWDDSATDFVSATADLFSNGSFTNTAVPEVVYRKWLEKPPCTAEDLIGQGNGKLVKLGVTAMRLGQLDALQVPF